MFQVRYEMLHISRLESGSQRGFDDCRNPNSIVIIVSFFGTVNNYKPVQPTGFLRPWRRLLGLSAITSLTSKPLLRIPPACPTKGCWHWELSSSSIDMRPLATALLSTFLEQLTGEDVQLLRDQGGIVLANTFFRTVMITVP